MKPALLLAAAAVLYAAAAWSVKPGFYDCCAGPSYAYVAPPPILGPGNVSPTSGSGDLQDGGFVKTRDQPTAQAAIQIPEGALAGPTSIQITPFAPPADTGGVTLTGNVYCITSRAELKPGSRAVVSLLVPPYQPFPNAMYHAADHTAATWTSLGGTFDQLTYLMMAQTASFGCFAVGYAKPNVNSSPRLGGALLPLITAILIAAVILGGLPLALRRRSRRRG